MGEVMRGWRRALAIAACLLTLACSPRIDRTHWQQMSPKEKDLYVRSLIGAEKVKERKGGNERVYSLPPQDYIRRIDDAYARGDRRRVDVIFEEMGSRRR